MLPVLSLANVEGGDGCARADSDDAPVCDHAFDAAALAGSHIPNGVLQGRPQMLFLARGGLAPLE